jgi:hypothetical protein
MDPGLTISLVESLLTDDDHPDVFQRTQGGPLIYIGRYHQRVKWLPKPAWRENLFAFLLGGHKALQLS